MERGNTKARDWMDGRQGGLSQPQARVLTPHWSSPGTTPRTNHRRSLVFTAQDLIQRSHHPHQLCQAGPSLFLSKSIDSVIEEAASLSGFAGSDTLQSFLFTTES